MRYLLLQLVLAAAAGLKSVAAGNCPGDDHKTVHSPADLLVPGVKKIVDGTSLNKAIRYYNSTEIPGSLVSVLGRLTLTLNHDGTSKEPLFLNIGGNWRKDKCYLGDFVLKQDSTMIVSLDTQSRDAVFRFSTRENPYAKITLNSPMSIFLMGNIKAKQSFSIMPYERFVNNNLLVLFNSAKNPEVQKPEEEYQPKNLENELGTVEAGNTIMNTGLISIIGTSLTIHNNFEYGGKEGEIYLHGGQLFLGLDRYQDQDLEIMSGQNIVFENGISTVFFSRNVYKWDDTRFAAVLRGCSHGNAIIFEDQVEGDYDGYEHEMDLVIHMPNGKRKFRFKVYPKKAVPVLKDSPVKTGKYKDGTMIYFDGLA